MTQTNAEKAEAIARRKQKDRALAHYKQRQRGPRYAGEKYECPWDESVTWEAALEVLPIHLRALVDPKDKRVRHAKTRTDGRESA